MMNDNANLDQVGQIMRATWLVEQFQAARAVASLTVGAIFRFLG
jgi:hypothetical protein